MVSKGDVEVESLTEQSSQLDIKQAVKLTQHLEDVCSTPGIEPLENETKAISFKIDTNNVDFQNHTSITFISDRMCTEEDITNDYSALMNATLKPTQFLGQKFVRSRDVLEGKLEQSKTQNHIFKLFPQSNTTHHNRKIIYERKLRKIDHSEIKSTAVRQPLFQSNARRSRKKKKNCGEKENRTGDLNSEQCYSVVENKNIADVQVHENSDPLLTFEVSVGSSTADMPEEGSRGAVFEIKTTEAMEYAATDSSHSRLLIGKGLNENVNNSNANCDEHPGQLCRLCASSGESMVYIFGEAGVHLGLRKKINSWLPTHVSQTDPLPKQICSKCIHKLLECHQFAFSCVEAEKKLNTLIKRKKFSCHTRGIFEADGNEISPIQRDQEAIKLENIFSSVESLDHSSTFTVENGEIDTIIPGLSDNEENKDFLSEESSEVELLDMPIEQDKTSHLSIYHCPLCCEGNMQVVQTNVGRLQTSDVHGSKLCTGEIVEHSCRSIIEGIHIKLEDEAEKSPDVKLDTKTEYNNIEELNCQGEEMMCFDEDNIKYELPEKNVSEELEHSESRVQDSGPVVCWVCGELMESLFDCLAHGLQAHGDTEEGIYPCSQCEESFCSSEDMSQHFSSSHFPLLESQQLYSCILCKHQFTTKRTLKSHVCTPASSAANHLACQSCGRTFGTRTRLLFHQKFHIPGSALECKTCDMSFTEEDHLYDHVRFRHKEKMHECNECGKVFNSQGALRGHTISHRNVRHHKCEVCAKGFMDKQTLKEHMVSHMAVKPFQCHICGKYLNRNSRLKKHLRSHELEKATEPQQCYQCEVCNETFPTEQLALVHAESGHSLGTEIVECAFQLSQLDKVFRCEYCEKCYALPGALNSHRACHANESLPFKCHICGAAFATFARVATHKVTHGIYDKKDEFNIPKMFLCDTCDKAYVHWTYLSVHWKMRHAEVKYMYKCKVCPEQFVNSWSLAYHRRTRHGDRPMPRRDGALNERKPYKCESCSKRYTSQQALDEHIELIHDQNNPGPSFQCDECGKCFARRFSLESHKKVHSDDKPHICLICKKTFVHSSGLSTHMRLHRGDKPHACNYCGKTFLQRGDRDDHVRKHTGEKPFVCEECPKSFRTRAMWFEHSRIHRDERPFPCDVCGASFRRSYALKNHKTIHSGQRPFTCEVCGKGFRQKHAMQKHVRTSHIMNDKDISESLLLDNDMQVDSHSSLEYIKEEI